MKTKSLLQAGALALALTANSLPAAVIFDSLGSGTIAVGGGPGTSWAQNFDVPAGNYTLSSVLLGMDANDPEGPISGSGFYVQLWTTVSGAPGTKVGDLSGNDNPYLAGQYSYTGSYSLTGGTSYYILAGSTSISFQWLRNATIGTGHTTYGNISSQSTSVNPDALQMQVDLSPVPEPTEWAAVSVAMLGLVYVAKRRLAPVRQ